MEIVFDMRKSDRQELIEACIHLFAQELKIDNKKFNLLVFANKEIRNVHNAHGMAIPLVKGCFALGLDPRMKFERLVETLAHEMVHIKQFVTGQIEQKGRSTYWKGKKIIKSKVSYYDLPWEIDAWSKEKVLAAKVFKFIEQEYEKVNKKSKKSSSKSDSVEGLVES